MSAGLLLALGLVGGCGAVARVLLEHEVSRLTGRVFPAGILVVNLAGAFVLGLLAGAAVAGDARRLAAVGFLGACTTFSTWMLDTDRLGRAGRRDLAVLNLVASAVLGLLMAWLGRELGTMAR